MKTAGARQKQQTKTREDGAVQMREEDSLLVLVGGKVVAGG
jgi:hypothetical protein